MYQIHSPTICAPLGEAIPPLPHMPSWCEYGKLYRCGQSGMCLSYSIYTLNQKCRSEVDLSHSQFQSLLIFLDPTNTHGEHSKSLFAGKKQEKVM